MKNMKDKVVLVTGSSSGIGKEIAIHFASLGAKVVITGRRENAITEVARICETVSPFSYKPLEIVADLNVDEDIERLVKATVDHFEKLDVLVNNAAIGALTAIDDINLMEKYQKLTKTNIRAPLFLVYLTVPYLQATMGCIINISSLGGLKPFPKMTVYCMAKAALDMMTSCLALEMGTKKIRVNSVNPGVVRSNFHRSAGMSEESVKMICNAYSLANPSGKIGESTDIAKAVVFLASDNASWISGCHLNVDGGSLFANCPTYDDLHRRHLLAETQQRITTITTD